MATAGEKEGDYEDAAAATGCSCFGLFSRSRSHYLLQERGAHEETWPVRYLKKLKEYSELVAGPKWKNMIRKIGKFCNPKKKSTGLQYSPGSYALNFDCSGDDEVEEDHLLHSFSSRFASHGFNDQSRKDGL